MMRTIRIGTRESRLAVIQTEIVAETIRAFAPEINVELVTMKTTGDKILNKTLDKIGGKGLFVKELDAALRRGDVDLCAHSYKDMPADEYLDLPVVAVGPREDPRDVLILPEGATELDKSKPIGCSSLRRRVQLGELYPDIRTAPVRGNVLTRLAKLDRGEFSALVLAYAGIKRLALHERVSRVFSPKELLPAGCQGAIAVQGRPEEDYDYLAGFHNRDSADTSTAERAFIRTLACGCGAPVGAYAELQGDSLWLRAMIADDEGRIFREEIRGPRADADALGQALAETMLERRECGVR